MGYSLGIDFGTSTTKVSIKKDDDPPIALPISDTGDREFMPSVIAYRRTSTDNAAVFAIGEDAERTPNTGDYQVIRDIKRFLVISQNASPNFPFQDYPWWNEKKNCVDLWSDTLSTEEVIREIVTEALKRAVRRARERELLPRHEMSSDFLTVRGWPMGLGCSVTAGLETRRALHNIARALGFVDFGFDDIQEEPILASLPYLERELRPGNILLVYDFGGGTFDTAIIRIDSPRQDGLPSITVLSAEGEPFCGGTDIDKAIAEYLANRIAGDYFGNDSKWVPEIRAKLLDEGRAREVKEILSGATEYQLVLPADFLDRPGIELQITRKEFDKVITETKLLERTTECVMRAWRRARMVYRKADEAHGEFYLKINRDSGVISKFVTQLGPDDLNENISRVLLVGGTTRIPLVHQHLESILNSKNFISETDPYQPIVACSLGGASRKAHVGAIVDRLPFSIVVRKGEHKQEIYRAYTPTVVYRVLTDTPRIESYISSEAWAVSKTDSVCIQYVAPDGETIKEQVPTLLPGRYVLVINCYGCISLKPLPLGTPVELENTAQHELQIAQWQSVLKEQDRKKEEDDRRTQKYLHEKPGEHGGGG